MVLDRTLPGPVKGILTVRWSEKADELIDSVSIYEHSTVHWKFRQKNYPQLGREMKIDMSGYYLGVYIIRFQLRDGRVVSKSIIKE